MIVSEDGEGVREVSEEGRVRKLGQETRVMS